MMTELQIYVFRFTGVKADLKLTKLDYIKVKKTERSALKCAYRGTQVNVMCWCVCCDSTKPEARDHCQATVSLQT